MRLFVSDYEQRQREVRRYLALIILFERKNNVGKTQNRSLDAKLLKASAMLVIYNLIEASTRNAIEAIYEEISAKRINFNALRNSFRMKIIKDFKKNAISDKVIDVTDISEQIILMSLNIESLFGGNVDGREIKRQSEIYGFRLMGDLLEKSRGGVDLVKVKRNRNDLAHGLKSFSEVGSNYTVSDVTRLGKESMAHMKCLIISVDNYLNQQDFLERPVCSKGA